MTQNDNCHLAHKSLVQINYLTLTLVDQRKPKLCDKNVENW